MKLVAGAATRPPPRARRSQAWLGRAASGRGKQRRGRAHERALDASLPRAAHSRRPRRCSSTCCPQHANIGGTVFGGQIMAWVDLCAAICAQRHAGRPCVTAFVDDLLFKRPVLVGQVVRLRARDHRDVPHVDGDRRERVRGGHRHRRDSGRRVECRVVFVAIDEARTPDPRAAPAPRRRTRTARRRRRPKSGGARGSPRDDMSRGIGSMSDARASRTSASTSARRSPSAAGSTTSARAASCTSSRCATARASCSASSSRAT